MQAGDLSVTMTTVITAARGLSFSLPFTFLPVGCFFGALETQFHMIAVWFMKIVLIFFLFL